MSACPKISVIIPIYNVEATLPRCLESCINQTLLDIEIICVNDGSTDNSQTILDEYAKLDNRMIVRHKKNGGLSSARNAGLSLAKGQWIMFLDSDDYYELQACERVWEESLEGPTDIIVFGTKLFPEYPAALPWYHWTLTVEAVRHDFFSPDVLFSNPNSKPFVWRQAFSRDILERTELLFDETVKFGEDLVFQMEIFPQAKHFSYISDSLYNYRFSRKGSLMDKVNQDFVQKINQHIEMVDKISKYWNKKKWLDKYGEDYLAWLLDFLVGDISKLDFVDKKQCANKVKNIISYYQLGRYKKKMKSGSLELWYRLEKI